MGNVSGQTGNDSQHWGENIIRLKESAYNFRYAQPGEDSFVIYNSRTRALSVLHKPQHEQLVEFLDLKKEISDTEFLDNLIKCGYLLPSDVDEHYLIRTRMMLGRYDRRTLTLTIAPTTACNFRCVYCYEQGHYGNQKMSPAIMEHVVRFVESQITGVERLHVTWYGGEPLLAVPVIEHLAQRFIRLCSDRKVTYSSSIVTNGYLYTKAVADNLKRLQVRAVQITIDGPKQVHDRRRVLANGGPTYEVIIENLIETKGVLPVTLRINADTENVEAASEVVSFLRHHGLLDTIMPYMAMVMPYNGASGDKCLSDESYAKEKLQFMVKNGLPIMSLYPTPRSNYCLADSCNGWVIADDGTLYKCWNDIGMPDKAIGSVSAPQVLSSTTLLNRYQSFDPTKDRECSTCKMLPVCLGGCPNVRSAGRKVCDPYRFQMQQYLLECSKHLTNLENRPNGEEVKQCES